MLVAARELTKDEVAPRNGGDGSFERHYSMYANDTSATVVDVHDGRARKTFNYDVRVTSNGQLSDIVIRPLLESVLNPGRASQAIIVADGTRAARDRVLFGHPRHTAAGEEGVVAATIQTVLQFRHVAAVYLAAVTLDDENRLRDILVGRGTRQADGESPIEPTILEDVTEQFTALEEASYHEITADPRRLQGLLTAVQFSLSETKHQIISIIVAFDDPDAMPNTTVQFVSFVVSELARGMKSTRHCVSTAASLIECRSPVMPFNGTKVSYLLKPALLGTQPGAWVSCFSPISFEPADPFGGGTSGVSEYEEQIPGLGPRETFKEAFSLAQMASRVYSTRIAIVEDGRVEPRAAKLNRGVLPERSHDHSFSPSVRTAPGSDKDGLVASPAVLRPQRETTPPGHATAANAPSTSGAQERQVADLQASLTRMTRELDTCRYRFADAQQQLDAERCRTTPVPAAAHDPDAAHGEQEQQLRTAALVLQAENELLRQELRDKARAYEDGLRASKASANSSQLQLTAQVSTALARLNASHEEIRSQSSEEVTILKARIAELLELVKYHQVEIQDHVTTEKAYRERILHLEEAVQAQAQTNTHLLEKLGSAKREAAAAAAAAAEKNRQQRARELGEPTDELRQLRADMADVAAHLQDAIALAERERQDRQSLERQVQRLRESGAARGESSAQPVDYDRQLDELRREMARYRVEHEAAAASAPARRAVSPSGIQVLSVTPPLPHAPPPAPGPVHGLPLPRHDASTPRPYREPLRAAGSAAPRQGRAAHSEEASVLSTRSLGSARKGWRRPHERSRSFEDFMQEESEYRLGRNLSVNPTPDGRSSWF